MKSLHFVLFTGAAALLTAGCSTAVSPAKSAQVDPAKTGLVLATVTESGVTNAWAEFALHSVDGHDGSLHNRAINTGKELWLLEVPPGRYRIADWTVAGGMQGSGTATPAAAREFEFEVRPGEVTYLGHFVIAGDLALDASGKHRTFVWARPVLEDRSAQAITAFRQQYPALAAVPVHSVAPQGIDLVPASEKQIGWNGPYYPENSAYNDGGATSMPSAPR